MTYICVQIFPSLEKETVIRTFEELLQYCEENRKTDHNLFHIRFGKQQSILKLGYGYHAIMGRDEANNLQKLQGIHGIPKYYWKHYSAEHKLSMLAMQYKEPPSLGRNVREAAPNLTDYEVLCIVFQVCFILETLQEKFTGFRHNDLKSDNVLLHITHIQDMFKRKGKTIIIGETIPKATIIDFEVTHSQCGHLQSSMVVESTETSTNVINFGLSPKPCSVFDIHLFMKDICTLRPSPDLVDMMRRVFPSDLEYTSKGRLTLESQERCKSITLQDILQDSYFTPLT